MQESRISCPHCGKEFELSEVLTGKIREHLKMELQREFTDKQKALEQRLKEVKVQAEADARESVETGLREMTATLQEKSDTIRELQDQELELRREKRKLQESREAMELEMARKLDEERVKIRDEAAQNLQEQYRLKDLEKEKIIKGLKDSLEDMRRKAQQGSMEIQGEVLEQDFEARLRAMFADDEISPVPKGVKGADLLQQVRSPAGRECGFIIWETKNTKAWSDAWIPKLKDDMIQVRAAVAVLVSRALPNDIRTFGQKEGIWVSGPSHAVGLAVALREQLMAVAQERAASEGKAGKMDFLYRYLSGNEFRQKVEGIVEAFQVMQEQLARERRAMEKLWKEREKQIERVIKNTVGMYGDMQGIIGRQLPEIAALELEGEGGHKTLPPD